MLTDNDRRRRPLTACDTPAPAAYRAVQVLDVLSQAAAPQTLTETATATGLAKSSVANLLTTLEAADMVRRTGNGWVVGFRALEIGQSVIRSTDLLTEFRRTVQSLPMLSQETVLLAVRDELQVLYLARHEGVQAMRVASEIGNRLPAVVTGLGKAMLAALPIDERDALLDTIDELPRPTNRSHASIEALRADLDSIRHRGFAIDFEQNTIGVSCFAVAIDGSCPPAAVSTTLVSQRVTPTLQEQLVAELRALAAELSVFAQ